MRWRVEERAGHPSEVGVTRLHPTGEVSLFKSAICDEVCFNGLSFAQREQANQGQDAKPRKMSFRCHLGSCLFLK